MNKAEEEVNKAIEWIDSTYIPKKMTKKVRGVLHQVRLILMYRGIYPGLTDKERQYLIKVKELLTGEEGR